MCQWSHGWFNRRTGDTITNTTYRDPSLHSLYEKIMLLYLLILLIIKIKQVCLIFSLDIYLHKFLQLPEESKEPTLPKIIIQSDVSHNVAVLSWANRTFAAHEKLKIFSYSIIRYLEVTLIHVMQKILIFVLTCFFGEKVVSFLWHRVIFLR